MSELKNDTSLPMSETAQQAFVGYVIKSEEFLVQVKNRIKSDWFISSKNAALYDLYTQFHTEFGYSAKKEEFFCWDVVACKDFSKVTELKQAWIAAEVQTGEFQKKFIADQLTKWLQTKIWHEASLRSADFFNAGKLSEAQTVMQNAIKEYEQANFNGEPPLNFASPLDLVAAQEVEHAAGLTTGLAVLDKKLNPDCKDGGLLRGDTTVILAPVNIGKSTTLITMARHNVARANDVLFISHEGRPRDIMEKMFCSMTKLTRSTFRAATKDPNHEFHQNVLACARALDKKLTYISMNKPGLTVEEVVSTVSAQQSKKKLATGKGFDMVIIDYPGILKSSVTRKGQEHRHEQDYVYRQFVQLALDENVHMVLAAQTNRAASRQNKENGSYKSKKNNENKLLGNEDIAEAFGIAQAATNLITVNRDPVSMQKGYMTLYIAKSRSSETDWAIACKTAFDRALAFSNELGATAYRGSGPMSDKIDSMVTQFNGSEIDTNSLIGMVG